MAAVSQRHGGAAVLSRAASAGGDPLPALVEAAAAAAAIAVAAGAATLLGRRLAGGFQTLPGPATTWLVTAAGIAVIAAADAAIRFGAVSRWTGVLPRVGLVLGLLALAAGAETGAAGGASLAAVALAAIVAVVPPPRAGSRSRPLAWPRPRSETAPRPPLPPSRSGSGWPWAEELPAPAAHLIAPEAFAPLLNDARAAGLRQRLERFETAGGEDRLVGRVIVSLTAGSRSGHAHIGFCPPFAALPAVEVTTDYDGVEAVVVAAEVVPWGVRVECRLFEPAEEPLEIPVDVVAHLGGP
jgi:hypothetical protein